MINSKLSGNDVCCLDIETNIWTNSIANFIIFLEILLKGHKKEDIDVNEILLEFLFDYFSKKEVMPGTSIKEWIDRYNKKTETYEGYPVRIYPLETMLLEDKTERLVVSSVKEELDGFEKTVNFFNDGTWDDVKAILKNENIKVSIETFDEVTEFNNLIDLWFRVKFIEDEKEKMKVEFSKDRGYKFSIEFEDLDSLMSLSYDNNEIRYRCKEESVKFSFSEIGTYGDEYIEYITKIINEVSCCIKRELRDKKGHEKKLVN